jgi:hypothetical protein
MMGCVPTAPQLIDLTAVPIAGFDFSNSTTPSCEASQAGLRCEIPEDKLQTGEYGFKIVYANPATPFTDAAAKETIVVRFKIAVSANSGVRDLTIAQFVRNGRQRVRLVLTRDDAGSTLRGIVGTKESARLPVSLSGQVVTLSISEGAASLDVGVGSSVSVILAADLNDQPLFQLGTFQNIGGGVGSVTYSNLSYARTCSN